MSLLLKYPSVIKRKLFPFNFSRAAITDSRTRECLTQQSRMSFFSNFASTIQSNLHLQ